MRIRLAILMVAMTAAVGLARAAELPAKLGAALKNKGPCMLEIDMLSIGSFKTSFAGPPVNKLDQIPALDPAVASSAA